MFQACFVGQEIFHGIRPPAQGPSDPEKYYNLIIIINHKTTNTAQQNKLNTARKARRQILYTKTKFYDDKNWY